MQTGLHIGNEMHKDGVDAVANALVRIMSAHADQKTIRAAIHAFSTMGEVGNISFNEVHVTGDTYEAAATKTPDNYGQDDDDELAGKGE